MKTYNDLLALGENEKDRKDFIITAIEEHQQSEMYQIALDAEAYNKKQNVTISKYRKILYDLQGNAVPDNWTANHKCGSNYFGRFVSQQAGYLLGNGVAFTGKTVEVEPGTPDAHHKTVHAEKNGVVESQEKWYLTIDQGTKKRLGADFDTRLYTAGKKALIQGVAFGFFNKDRVQTFELLEFVPLYDEEDGALKAGIRFWQISDDKPLRATLYELDGYTDYIRRGNDKKLETLREKRAYKLSIRSTPADGEEIFAEENYPSFPIVPLWGNVAHQSELVGMRENIDCYDLIKSGFANDLDDASMIYWVLENAGGMDDIDLARFVERMKTVRAALTSDNVKATAHTQEVPYQSREVYLNRLRDDMYEDYMALDTKKLSSGNVTATQIIAAYEPMNSKADEFEFCVIEFIKGILALAGIEDTPTFKRERIANQTEQTAMVLSAAEYLDDETILRKLPWITEDEITELLERKDAEESARYTGEDPEGNTQTLGIMP